MSERALYLNGVYEAVLSDIAEVQEHVPEQVLYLQPYSSRRIREFVDDPPSFEEPVPIYMSLTDELEHVRYVGEVVGWENKQEMEPHRLHHVNKTVLAHQPTEIGGIYEEVRGGECVNLLQVRGVRELDQKYPVDELVKLSDGEPHGLRERSGGWSYVRPVDELSVDA